jgi:predicted RNA-binding protein
MCEANVFVLEPDGKEVLYLENVDRIIPNEDGTISLESVFSERKTIKAIIKELALVNHKVILQRV